uniref:NADH-ubiquinone oxidoreductase chain 4L n=1 Tax=Physosmaragdina nigrifrons TaxID=1453301 RepID=A0A890CD94_9CUCU|nr:NADH dehydrogenase subunit 4L [Physosmaragdina nigrifrons]QRG29986.1 NADH dehydrogenase subunit 4L [Physosmaragdina nigrifrons]
MSLLVFMLMFLSGLISFSLLRSHLLSMLLSLEFLALSLYFGIFTYLSLIGYEYFFGLIYLTMSVCEASLGLAILVMMVRSYGNDYVLSLNSLW